MIPLARKVIFVLAAGGCFHAAALATEPAATLTDSLGIRLVRIPAGEFLMGGVEPAEQLVAALPGYGKPPEFFGDEYPRHRVKITRPFYLGQCEVTVGQFRRFAEASGYRTEPERDGTGGWGYNPQTGKCEGRRLQFTWRNPGFPQTDEHPVVNVTWNDAVAFCQWLGRKEGKAYRLPTEAQWEYACRAGTSTRYNTGGDPEGLLGAAVIADFKGKPQFLHVQDQVHLGKDAHFTAPVGQRPPNAWGLCDMHGNVWEWCADWYGADYYGRSPLEDPNGPDQGTVRVRRGGAWNSYPMWLRASFRNWNTPASRCVNLGLRVLREE